MSFLGSAPTVINFRFKTVLWNRKFGLKSSPGTVLGRTPHRGRTCIVSIISFRSLPPTGCRLLKLICTIVRRGEDAHKSHMHQLWSARSQRRRQRCCASIFDAAKNRQDLSSTSPKRGVSQCVPGKLFQPPTGAANSRWKWRSDWRLQFPFAIRASLPINYANGIGASMRMGQMTYSIIKCRR